MLEKSKYLIILICCILTLLFTARTTRAGGSFFYMGDGKIALGRGYKGKIQTVRFRDQNGTYIREGLKAINGLYGTPWNQPEARMSLRLIELLDYLEDSFNGKNVRIISGYRSPNYNQKLRDKGKLAASSSLHIDAEAIDIVMGGVSSSKLNDYLRPRECCGVGYYHGKTIHIDTGPARFWDETSSGTEKKEPPQNEHITIKTKSDRYLSGEPIGIKFSRINDYPIGVSKKAELICSDGGRLQKKKLTLRFEPSVKSSGGGCMILTDRRESRTIFADAPSKMAKSACRVHMTFCNPVTEKMPTFVESHPIVISR